MLALETLESRLTPTATNNYIVTSLADGVGTVTADNGSNPGSNFDATTLRAAITAATADGGNDTITFAPGIYSGNTATISLSAALAANNSASLGAAAFVIGNNITIQGPTGSNTLTIAGGGSVAQEFRFATVTSAGTLSLNNVTLSSFYEAGGNGGYSANSNKNGGGGGLGAGGAILNEGTLNLSYVTIANCTAIGGNGGAGETQGGTGTWSGNAQGGGGGMGASADVSADAGGPNGATASTAAGVGGGGSGVATTNNVHTGGFGGGGAGDNASNTWQGSGSNGGYGGGGGGAGYTTTGDYLEVAGAGGFGAGAGDFGYSGNQQSGAGGGGSGQGGAIFNLGGTITISNSTIVGNSAIGGNGGVYEGGNGKTQDQGYYGYGLGGGVFNLNGTVAVTSSSITSNGVANGTTAAPITYQLAQTEVSTGSDFYNLSDGDPQVTAVASKGTANVTLTNATLGQGSPSTVASYINTVFAGGAGYTNAGTGWVIADNSVNTSTTGGDFVGTAGGTYHSTVHYGTSGLITSASYAGTEVAGVGVAGVGTPFTVSTPTPTVTSSSSDLADNQNTFTIYGTGFDSTPGNNTVTFNDGAVGPVTSASSTSLVVTFTTQPTTASSLTVIVTTDGVNSGGPVQVALVTPVVSSDPNNIPANSNSLVITGFGFDPNASNNSIIFSDGAVGTVTAATPTALQVTLTKQPAVAGPLNAQVTTDNIASGQPKQFATVAPVVTSSAAELATNAPFVTFRGFGFDPNPANNVVVFDDGAFGTVTNATANSLTVDFTTPPNMSGPFTAAVTTDGVSSGVAVQLGTVVTPLAVATSSLGNTTYGQSYNQTIQATGGAPSYTFTITTGNLPTGLSLSNSGTISGTANAAGSYTFTVQVADAGGLTASEQYTILVNQASLTVTANAASTTYGATLPDLNYTYVGLVNGDSSATFTGSLATTATSASNVGGYDVTAGTLAATGNYTIGTFNAATLTVTPALLTVTASDASTTYGASLPTLNYTYVGLVNGDGSASFTGSLATSATAASNVGGYDISVGTLAATGNYTVGAFNAATLTVTPALLTVTASDASTVYGGTLPALNYTYNGLVNGDSSASFSGSLSTTATPTSNAGGYAIDVGTLSVGGNYTIGTFNTGTLTITPALLTVTASDATTTYGTLPTLNYTFTGLVNDDISPTFTGSLAASGSNVGSYSISVGTLTATGNYTIGAFNAATLTVTPALLTVTASDASTTYGSTLPALSYTYTGLVNGDSSANFSGSVATTATSSSSVGGYGISVGTLAVSGNYAIGTFNAGTLTVTPALLAVTATSTSITVNSAIPPLSYTYTGLVNGDSSAAFTGGLTTTATSASNAGLYPINEGSLAVTGNYAIGSFTAGTLSIIPTGFVLTDNGPNASESGQAVSFTVTIGNNAVPNGQTIRIEDESNYFAIVASPVVNNGVATFTVSNLGLGVHYLIAEYGLPKTSGYGQSNIVAQTVMAGFGVGSVTATPGGVVLDFDAPINPNSTVLYSSPGDTTYGPADITVVGASTGPVRGSLVIDPTNPNEATFVQTSGLLPADTYTVTVTSAVTAADGSALSGNSVSTVVVSNTSTPVVSLPSFARGPGQSVVLTDSQGNATGLPVSISQVTGATQASFSLTFDPTLLTIAGSGALTLSTSATAAGMDTVSYTIVNVDSHHSLLTANITSSQPGGAGLTSSSAIPLVTITANVPSTAPYLNKALLNVSSVVVNGAAGAGVSAVDEAAYIGDVSGAGSISALDASLVDQVGAGSGTGFSAYKDLDPAIIGSVSGGADVSSLDASLINEAGAGAAIPGIPAIPTGMGPLFTGADPYLYLSSVQGSAGQTVTETLYLDVTDPNGIQLSALDEAIGFDAGALHVSNVRAAAGLAGLGSYQTIGTADNGSGVLLVGQAFAGSGLPPVVPYGTDVAVLQFDVTLNANASVGAVTGLTLLQDGTINGETKYTAISDNEGALTWTPGKVPSNTGNAAIDGSVTVVPYTAPADSEVVTPTKHSTDVVQSKASVVKRVVPSAPVSSTPVSQPALDILTSAPPATASSSDQPAASDAAAAAHVTIVIDVTVQSPLVLSVQAEANMVTISATTASLTTGTSVGRGTDPGVALSLAEVATNKATPAASTANVKSSTSTVDEMFRLLGSTLGVPQANASNTGASDTGMSDEDLDALDLEYLLLDQDSK